MEPKTNEVFIAEGYINKRVVVYDGAFGTYVQTLGLGPDDFGSEHLEGCNELLVATRPDAASGRGSARCRSRRPPGRPA